MKRKKLFREKKYQPTWAQLSRRMTKWRIRRINEAYKDPEDMACIAWLRFWTIHQYDKVVPYTIYGMKRLRRYLRNGKIKENAAAKARYEEWVNKHEHI